MLYNNEYFTGDYTTWTTAPVSCYDNSSDKCTIDYVLKDTPVQSDPQTSVEETPVNTYSHTPIMSNIQPNSNVQTTEEPIPFTKPIEAAVTSNASSNLSARLSTNVEINNVIPPNSTDPSITQTNSNPQIQMPQIGLKNISQTTTMDPSAIQALLTQISSQINNQSTPATGSTSAQIQNLMNQINQLQNLHN